MDLFEEQKAELRRREDQEARRREELRHRERSQSPGASARPLDVVSIPLNPGEPGEKTRGARPSSAGGNKPPVAASATPPQLPRHLSVKQIIPNKLAALSGSASSSGLLQTPTQPPAKATTLPPATSTVSPASGGAPARRSHSALPPAGANILPLKLAEGGGRKGGQGEGSKKGKKGGEIIL